MILISCACIRVLCYLKDCTYWIKLIWIRELCSSYCRYLQVLVSLPVGPVLKVERTSLRYHDARLVFGDLSVMVVDNWRCRCRPGQTGPSTHPRTPLGCVRVGLLQGEGYTRIVIETYTTRTKHCLKILFLFHNLVGCLLCLVIK